MLQGLCTAKQTVLDHVTETSGALNKRESRVILHGNHIVYTSRYSLRQQSSCLHLTADTDNVSWH